MENYAKYKFQNDEIWEIVEYKRTGKGFINVNCMNKNNNDITWIFQITRHSPLEENYRGIDWLNEHHFDYRGLIKQDLALKPIKGMYETQE
jgi:hypothetical protein